MIFSIVPLQTGMYRATALTVGKEYTVLGFSHSDALDRLFAALKALNLKNVYV